MAIGVAPPVIRWGRVARRRARGHARDGAGDINIPASRAGLHPLSPAPI